MTREIKQAEAVVFGHAVIDAKSVKLALNGLGNTLTWRASDASTEFNSINHQLASVKNTSAPNGKRCVKSV